MSSDNYQLISKECLILTDIYIKHYGKGAVIMRINSINRIYNTYNNQGVSATKTVEKVNSKDEVDLSSQAKDFASVKKMLTNIPDVRNEKVQQIKRAMEEGTYDVSSKEVAQKILSQNTVRY